MDRLPTATYLLMFYCVTFVCINGRGQDFPSCEIGLMVNRGTTWKVSPQQRLTVRCPVKHCGQSLNVTWCKLLDKCDMINYTENVEIRLKNDGPDKDELTSFLTFKRISINDDGLYRCYIKGYGEEQISHTINISVSDLNQGLDYSDGNTDESPGVADDEDMSWLPYLSICFGVASLVFMSTVLILLSFYTQKRIMTNNHTKKQELSTHMIPNLPKGSAPSTLFLQTHLSVLNDIHTPSTAEQPPSSNQSQPPPTSSGNQSGMENSTHESPASNHAVYAVIKHQQARIPAREHCTVTE